MFLLPIDYLHTVAGFIFGSLFALLDKSPKKALFYGSLPQIIDDSLEAVYLPYLLTKRGFINDLLFGGKLKFSSSEHDLTWFLDSIVGDTAHYMVGLMLGYYIGRAIVDMKRKRSEFENLISTKVF